jgi:hypothetical protein
MATITIKIPKKGLHDGDQRSANPYPRFSLDVRLAAGLRRKKQ